jgi:hypothetical protein
MMKASRHVPRRPSKYSKFSALFLDYPFLIRSNTLYTVERRAENDHVEKKAIQILPYI